MTANSTNPRFLANGTDLGLVAVGFSGGQVSTACSYILPYLTRLLHSANPVSTLRRWPLLNLVSLTNSAMSSL